MGNETQAFADSRGIKILNSTPYYAQANGPPEEPNKIIINIIEKMVKQNPRNWDKLLSEALWACQTSKSSSTGGTLFLLTYGHDAMLPIEVTIRSVKRALQNYLEPVIYNEGMIAKSEELDEVWLSALDCLVV